MSIPPRGYTYGDIVIDSDDADPNMAIVVNTPRKPANEWDVPPAGNTVADTNPEYPEDAPVVVIVYRDELDEYLSNWADRDGPIALQQLHEDEIPYYSFPEPRLSLVEPSPVEWAREEPLNDVQLADVDGYDRENENRSGGNDDNPRNEQDCSEHDDQDSRHNSAEITQRASSTEKVENAAEEPEQTEKNENTSGLTEDISEPLPKAVAELKTRLSDAGMDIEVGDDRETLRVTKVGETYRVRPGAVIEGEGALRSRLEEITSQYDSK